ncbi:MAG: sugar phosphate nucleotidyltransferase [Candidatus Hodarchaeota archaeon]
MKAVILAGGLGLRLRPFTEIIPKPLLPIGEKAVLEIQIEHLKVHGFNEVFLATNYRSDYIEKFLGNGLPYGVKLTISKEEKPLGTAGPLTLLKKELNEPFIVINGDILSSIDFSKFYRFALEKDTMLTIAIKQMITPFAFGNIYFKNDFVTNIEEKPNFVAYVLAGIYAMKPDILTMIPDNEYYNMDVLIKSMLSKGIPIAKYEMTEYWLDIGAVEDFEEAEDAYNKHLKVHQSK